MPLSCDCKKTGYVPPGPRPQRRPPGRRRRRFDERKFFDRMDYIAVRLFLLVMALVGMYSVLKAHL
jgi:membrane protein required for beta-lactamase induction